MRAAVLRDGQVILRDDVPELVPGVGEILVKVSACGICGSDLHFVKQGGTLLEMAQAMRGVPEMARPPLDIARDVFMGHEFSAEVIEAGPGTDGPAPGTLVTSVPALLTTTGLQDLAYNNQLPAGYSEQMLLSAPLVLEVPNGLDAARAALTEPMAVGIHAVNRSAITPGEIALVIGCGPVGLAVIAALRLRGIESIVASDFSPARRRLATTMGAHVVADPAVDDPWESCQSGLGGGQLVVFEAVGMPGLIDDILRCAPPNARVVVVGVCMGTDQVTPFWGIAKELNVQFVLAYDLAEFAASLDAIAEGRIDVRPMITGSVALEGLPAAFEELAQPERHCKILVTP